MPPPPVFLTEVPARKTWWAKRVTSSLYTGGRLSSRQIKGASEDCFKSIVYIYEFTNEGMFGDLALPAASDVRAICQQSGLEFDVLGNTSIYIDDDEDGLEKWATMEMVKCFDELYKKMTKPMLVCSNTGYSATFLAFTWLLYTAQQDRPAAQEDLITLKDLFVRASDLGYNYADNDCLRKLVEEVSGEAIGAEVARPDLSLPYWYKTFWWARPVHKNWYISGQLQTNQLNLLKKLSIKVVLNTRLGVTTNGRNTQEEVTLLNIGETSKTHTGDGRQAPTELVLHRIDDSKPVSYIAEDSKVNYEARNSLEFGDDIGYNEDTQKENMKTAGLDYIHTPIVSHGYEVDMYEDYKQQWLDISKKGNIMCQCRTGHRAAVAAIVTLGVQYNKDMAWALSKLWNMGYRVNTTDDPDVYILLEYVLGNKDRKTDQ